MRLLTLEAGTRAEPIVSTGSEPLRSTPSTTPDTLVSTATFAPVASRASTVIVYFPAAADRPEVEVPSQSKACAPALSVVVLVATIVPSVPLMVTIARAAAR